MARIETYNNDNTINPTDKLIGTDGAVGALNATKNFEVQDLKNYMYQSLSHDILKKDLTVTSTQILSLNNGGTVELIAAPGTGKLLYVINALIHLDFATTAYNFAAAELSDGLGLTLGTTNLQNDNGLFSTNINSTSDTFFVGDPIAPSSGTQVPVNAALNLFATSGMTVSQGDSPIKMSILYREITLP
jgi:hypothetical protein